MPYYTPEYNLLSDRLDRLAATAGVSAQAVALVNPEWDGGAYIVNARMPTQPLDFTPDLTPIAQAARDALYPIANPRDYIDGLPFAVDGQIAADFTGIATLRDAAWQSAKVRLLMPGGAVFGKPNLGSEFLLGVLTAYQGDARLIESFAADLLALDGLWYQATLIDVDLRQPLLMRLATNLRLLAAT